MTDPANSTSKSGRASTARTRREQRSSKNVEPATPQVSTIRSGAAKKQPLLEKLRPAARPVVPNAAPTASRSPATPKTVRRTTPRPHTPPPALVRSGLQGMASPKKRSGTADATRRRFDVALTGLTGVPGAELRLPSVPSSWLNAEHSGLWRLLSGLLCGLMLVSLYFLTLSPTFQVRTAEVKGVQRLSATDINLVLGLNGAQVVTLDTAELERNLSLAFPELESVDVRIGLPARVVVNAVERQPVLRWVNGNTEQWIDRQGIIFPPRGDPGELLLIQGETLPGMIEEPVGLDGILPVTLPGSAPALLTRRVDPAVVEKIITMQTVIPAGTPLLFTAAHGFGWQDPQGWEVYFGGQTTDLEQRLELYQQIVNHLSETGETPALISVELIHRPYYRMER